MVENSTSVMCLIIKTSSRCGIYLLKRKVPLGEVASNQCRLHLVSGVIERVAA